GISINELFDRPSYASTIFVAVKPPQVQLCYQGQDRFRFDAFRHRVERVTSSTRAEIRCKFPYDLDRAFGIFLGKIGERSGELNISAFAPGFGIVPSCSIREHFEGIDNVFVCGVVDFVCGHRRTNPSWSRENHSTLSVAKLAHTLLFECISVWRQSIVW